MNSKNQNHKVKPKPTRLFCVEKHHHLPSQFPSPTLCVSVASLDYIGCWISFLSYRLTDQKKRRNSTNLSLISQISVFQPQTLTKQLKQTKSKKYINKKQRKNSLYLGFVEVNQLRENFPLEREKLFKQRNGKERERERATVTKIA